VRLSAKRLFAYWLDFVLLASVLVGFQWLFHTTTSGFPFSMLDEGYEIELWVLLTMSLPVWLYFICCEMRKQQTVGKRFPKLAVMNREGGKINFKQALFRTLIRLLPWELTHIAILVPEPWWATEAAGTRHFIFVPNALMILYIVYLFANKGRQGIHDRLANTIVKER